MLEKKLLDLSDHFMIGRDYTGSPVIIMCVAELSTRLSRVLPEYHVTFDAWGTTIQLKFERRESNE